VTTSDNSTVDPKPGADLPNGNTAQLSGIRLVPGEFLHLQTLSETNPKRYQVSIIGAHAPQSVLVSAPMIMGKLLFIKEGKQLLVRGFVGKDAFAYRANVIKSALTPYPYLHLSYPESVQSMRIRKSVRVAVEIVAAVSTPTTDMAARIVDLSSGGARLSANQKLGEDGAEITLKFRVYAGDQDVYLTIQAAIRSGMPDDSQPGMFNTGVEFINLEGQQRLCLENQIYQRLLDNLRS
jgi:c-di-GMP-binding flagellar brake protein YcgR